MALDDSLQSCLSIEAWEYLTFGPLGHPQAKKPRDQRSNHLLALLLDTSGQPLLALRENDRENVGKKRKPHSDQSLTFVIYRLPIVRFSAKMLK